MAFSQLMGKAHVSHQRVAAEFPTAKPRFESVAKICRRWRRRYRRKGFGRPLRQDTEQQNRSVKNASRRGMSTEVVLNE
jgi:hypothetical protein